MTNQIAKIIVNSLVELNEELEKDQLDNPTKDTKIYGGGGVLDSLQLVSFITDLEGLISDEFDVDIVLADEKAMGQRNSPFNSVESLTKYIEQLLNKGL